MPAGHDNPQTGPFWVEGAEPGDTLAIHIVSLEPARDYGVSSFSPGFGALVGTDRTAMLGPDFPETDVALRRGHETKRGPHDIGRPQTRLGGSARAVPRLPRRGARRRRSTLDDRAGTFGGNMDCWEVRAGNTVFLGVNAPEASCRSAMATTRWARERSWAPPSRAR